MSDPTDDLAEAALLFARAILAARGYLDDVNVSVNEAARRLGVSRSTVYNMKDRGEIATQKIGGRRLIPISEIQRVKRERQT